MLAGISASTVETSELRSSSLPWGTWCLRRLKKLRRIDPPELPVLGETLQSRKYPPLPPSAGLFGGILVFREAVKVVKELSEH